MKLYKKTKVRNFWHIDVLKINSWWLFGFGADKETGGLLGIDISIIRNANNGALFWLSVNIWDYHFNFSILDKET